MATADTTASGPAAPGGLGGTDWGSVRARVMALVGAQDEYHRLDDRLDALDAEIDGHKKELAALVGDRLAQGHTDGKLVTINGRLYRLYLESRDAVEVVPVGRPLALDGEPLYPATLPQGGWSVPALNEYEGI